MCNVQLRQTDTKKEQQPEQTNVNFSQVVSDLEIVEIVETEWHDATRDVGLYMNEICEMYLSLHTATIPQNPKYLHNIPDVHFSRFPDQTKLEQVFSTKLKHHMISSTRILPMNWRKISKYSKQLQKLFAKTLR